MQISQQDAINRSDSGYELSDSSSTVLKRRAIMNSRSSNEFLSVNSSMPHSDSTNCFNDLQSKSAPLNLQNTCDLVDNSLSSKQAKPLFEGLPHFQLYTNESACDDQQKLQQYDQNLPSGESSNNDYHSLSCLEKPRKQTISTKIFRPFQIRLKKKS